SALRRGGRPDRGREPPRAGRVAPRSRSRAGLPAHRRGAARPHAARRGGRTAVGRRGVGELGADGGRRGAPPRSRLRRMSANDRPTTATAVVPVFNEEENLEGLYDRLAPVLDAAFDDWEILFVDDGSSDRSASVIRRLRERDSRVCAIRLAKNVG